MTYEQFEKAEKIVKEIKGLQYLETYFKDAYDIEFICKSHHNQALNHLSNNYYIPLEILEEEVENMKLNILNKAEKLKKQKFKELQDL